MNQQNHPQIHNQQQQQQQQQQQLKRRTTVNKNNSNKLPTTRKRSHSSSSSTSSGSPSTNLFSTTSSSDSGSSSMTSVKSNITTKKKRITGNDSSINNGNTSSPQMRSITSTLFTSPGAIPPRLIAQRSVPAFLNKLYNMVEDLTTNDLIRWSKDGTSFIVEKHEEFAKNVLPRFYKHNTFASFVRQLNMYDFHKVPHLQQGVLIAESEHEIWEFSNPHFRRGRPDLLVLVTRKRNRDRETVDTENISLSTLVEDLATVKKYQSTISTDLRDLHRDNEILWQETLNAREKSQRHQEAIEKILQFLTAIFANDHLAISMNNADALPKGLIEEAASLAGMSTKPDESTSNRLKSELLSSSSSSTPASSLTNILSSVMRLYSNNAPPATPLEISPHNMYKNDRHTSISSSTDSLQYPQSPQEASNEDNKPSLIDFSKTLNTATKSAQTITQDIDMLQVNIESLASDLGIDPSQFNEDLETDHCFQDNYSNMINSANSADRAKLYAIADSNADLDKKNYSIYDHKKEQHVISSTNGFSFNLQNPPLDHFQRNLQRSSSFPMQGYSSNDSNNTRQNTNKSMQQQNDFNTSNESYNQLISMNYPDSFGTNYPNENTNSTTPATDYHQQQTYDNSRNNQSRLNNNSYYNNSNTSTNPDNILPSGTTSSEYNNMNGYADMMRPSYFNTATNGNDNYNDA